MPAAAPEVVKWFTRARRFPQLIGRTPDGARLWGGPYTVTQVAGAGVFLFLGTRTMGWWARYGLITNVLLLLSLTYGLVLLLGRIPVGARNPWSIVTGALRAMTAPPSGRLAGRPVRLRRPHQVRHRIVLQPPAPAAPPATPPAQVEAAPDRAHPRTVPSASVASAPGRARRPLHSALSQVRTARLRSTSPTAAAPVAPSQLTPANRAPAAPAPSDPLVPEQSSDAPAAQSAADPPAAAPPDAARQRPAQRTPAGRPPGPALTGVQQLLARATATAAASPSTTSSTVGVLPRPADARITEDQ